jgi:hypothetical protein
MQRRRSSGGTLIRPVMAIAKNGENWTLTMPSSLRSGNLLALNFSSSIMHEFLLETEPEICFKDGEEFEETVLNDKKIKCLIKTEGENKLIEFQKDYETGQVLTTIIREVIGDKLIQVLSN